MVSIDGLGNGGVQAIMMGIVRSLSKYYHFDMLLFTSEVRHYDEEFLSYGGTIFRIPLYEGVSAIRRKIGRIYQDLYIYRKVDKLLLEQESYDVIHCNKQLESAPILIAAAKNGIPIRICHTHVITIPSRFPFSLIDIYRRRLIIKYSTHKIGCSTEACKTFFGESASYQVFPNFFDDKKYVFTPYCQQKEKQLVLVQVGAISETKNQLFSVKVLKNIVDRGIDATLKIIGFVMQKDYKDSLVNAVSSYGLTEKVVFIPGDVLIPDYFKEANAFLMPSKMEGFGIVLIEAQAVGLRCFASDHIPSEANCGGVTYIDINNIYASKDWADIIIERFENGLLNHQRYNVDKYKMSNVMSQVTKIYCTV